MAVNKNGIVVLGAVFVDIKGFPEDIYVPDGRNAGHVEYIHGGVSWNCARPSLESRIIPHSARMLCANCSATKSIPNT